MPEAIRLEPSFRERVWGRKSLAPLFPGAAPEKPIGEVWFESQPPIPLLIKFLFTTERLSVQVHPDDGEDGPLGKTEMWHILSADPGATIALGFKEPITRERLRESTRTGDVEHLLNWMPAKVGETYYTPAHTVHAIGAGIVLCEIQQNSDVTYRLWDYGRPREIHVEKAVPISDLDVHPGPVQPRPIAPGHEELVRAKYFVTESIELGAGQTYTPDAQRCQLLITLEGAARIGDATADPGQVWLLPESGPQPAISAAGPARLLRTYVP